MNKPEPEVIDTEQDYFERQEVSQLVQKFQHERTCGWLELKFSNGILVEVVERHSRRP